MAAVALVDGAVGDVTWVVQGDEASALTKLDVHESVKKCKHRLTKTQLYFFHRKIWGLD